jgi:putative transposase
MWGTDGVRIATVGDGMAWIFSAIDYCDGMRTGIHAAKIGDRFAALDPTSQGPLGAACILRGNVNRSECSRELR